MNLKKVVSVALLFAFGAGTVALVKNHEELKGWIENLVDGEKIISAGLGMQLGDYGSASQGEAALPENPDVPESFPPFPSDIEIPEQTPAPEKKEVILPTTIEGGMVVRNNTDYIIDLPALIIEGPPQKLASEGVQILIIHTHGSEAYTLGKNDTYTLSDNYRTEDKNYNVIRVGDELASLYESYGLNVIHDREIYDYPSYAGSYSRSGQAIEKYLKEHPEISIVIDLHRDAIGSDGVVYKTVAEANGIPCSQVMLLIGTDGNGLEHRSWLDNMKLALYLQSAAVNKYPTLTRPIAIKKERYNQHLTRGSFILEVGSNGNTLDEAIQAIRLFADATAPALLDLVTQPE